MGRLLQESEREATEVEEIDGIRPIEEESAGGEGAVEPQREESEAEPRAGQSQDQEEGQGEETRNVRSTLFPFRPIF